MMCTNAAMKISLNSGIKTTLLGLKQDLSALLRLEHIKHFGAFDEKTSNVSNDS